MEFTLCQVWDRRFHTFSGFDEVVETIRWGLEELGHRALITQNRLAHKGVNILFGLFGTNAISSYRMMAMPANVIAYNLEQIANAAPEVLNPAYHVAAKRMLIWEYSERNFPALNRLEPTRAVVHVPVGWAPTLHRIPKRAPAFDVLIYGWPHPRRQRVFEALCRDWIRTIFACGAYGTLRDDLISRAKIVLNLSGFENNRVFEIVRTSYLMGNGRVVVSDEYPEYEIEPALREAICFCRPEEILATIKELLHDESRRAEQARHARGYMEARDIRPILQRALAASGLA